MIYESLYILKKSLDYYLRSTSGLLNQTEDEVILGNIAYADLSGQNDMQDLSNKVVISLVSVEEDASLKNQNAFVKKGNGYEKQNPKVFANLNILISANYPASYENALKRLNKVIQFIQGQNIFRYKDSPLPDLSATPKINNLQVNLEMLSLNFEQLNHLWGSLGGKIIPSVLYKARVVEIEREAVQSTGSAITEVYINEKK